MITQERTLHVGSTDDVWARITERTGADVSTVPIQLRVIDPDGVVGSWAAPNAENRPTPDVIRASVRHTASVAGRHAVQAKLTPTGRTVILTVGTFNVITP